MTFGHVCDFTSKSNHGPLIKRRHTIDIQITRATSTRSPFSHPSPIVLQPPPPGFVIMAFARFNLAFRPLRYSIYCGVSICTIYTTAAIVDERKKRPTLFRMVKFKEGNQWWSRMRESQATVLALIGANAAVFAAWRLPGLYPLMHRYFMLSHSSHPLSLGLCMFSHQQVGHFIFNSLALYSFGTILHDQMGREHFLAFYLSAGLSSSLGSYLYRWYQAEAFASLGASGAIFGVVGALAKSTDIQVSTIIFPFVSVPLSKAFPCLVAFDTIGLFRNWKTLDHAAHLSGAGFGYLCKDPLDKLWRRRSTILRSLGLSRFK